MAPPGWWESWWAEHFSVTVPSKERNPEPAAACGSDQRDQEKTIFLKQYRNQKGLLSTTEILAAFSFYTRTNSSQLKFKTDSNNSFRSRERQILSNFTYLESKILNKQLQGAGDRSEAVWSSMFKESLWLQDLGRYHMDLRLHAQAQLSVLPQNK